MLAGLPVSPGQVLPKALGSQHPGNTFPCLLSLPCQGLLGIANASFVHIMELGKTKQAPQVPEDPFGAFNQ